MLVLTQKQLGHALFFSIKHNDFDNAEYLLKIDAPVNTSYFIGQDQIAYTTNLLVAKVAETFFKFGPSHAKSQQMVRILDGFIAQKCDLKCHCVAKNPHYCPISQILRYFTFECGKDLLRQQNLLILKLLYNGATYRNLTNSKDQIWIGIEELQAYIATRKEEVIELIKMNRHHKPCTNRHVRCSTGNKARLTEII